MNFLFYYSVDASLDEVKCDQPMERVGCSLHLKSIKYLMFSGYSAIANVCPEVSIIPLNF